jgi:hypothetical protein
METNVNEVKAVTTSKKETAKKAKVNAPKKEVAKKSLASSNKDNLLSLLDKLQLPEKMGKSQRNGKSDIYNWESERYAELRKSFTPDKAEKRFRSEARKKLEIFVYAYLHARKSKETGEKEKKEFLTIAKHYYKNVNFAKLDNFRSTFKDTKEEETYKIAFQLLNK